MNKYIFDVQFEYVVEADSYDQAVRLADKLLPDENGLTTFVVKTDEYGFVPNGDTIEAMREWGDFLDPNIAIVDFETGEVLSEGGSDES